jgi:hypothetical protein
MTREKGRDEEDQKEEFLALIRVIPAFILFIRVLLDLVPATHPAGD